MPSKPGGMNCLAGSAPFSIALRAMAVRLIARLIACRTFRSRIGFRIGLLPSAAVTNGLFSRNWSSDRYSVKPEIVLISFVRSVVSTRSYKLGGTVSITSMSPASSAATRALSFGMKPVFHARPRHRAAPPRRVALQRH